MQSTKEKFYVSRFKDGKLGYVGPMPESRAVRERDAWQNAGYEARAIIATPDVRKLVNKWQREANVHKANSAFAPSR
jgi:hypothetical protein